MPCSRLPNAIPYAPRPSPTHTQREEKGLSRPIQPVRALVLSFSRSRALLLLLLLLVLLPTYVRDSASRCVSARLPSPVPPPSKPQRDTADLARPFNHPSSSHPPTGHNPHAHRRPVASDQRRRGRGAVKMERWRWRWEWWCVRRANGAKRSLDLLAPFVLLAHLLLLLGREVVGDVERTVGGSCVGFMWSVVGQT